jgi:YYY domain-containing protein
MFQFILWYLTITLLGLLTFPLAYSLFPALADRGYSLSRALGLLLWGGVFWLSVSLGISRNEIGGLLFALALVVSLSFWVLWARQDESFPGNQVSSTPWTNMRDWLKTNLRLVISVEGLFLVAFVAWAFVRANNPETTGTEKPMEIAFINAILHSPTFPPHDPWLSGYAISYYYFGYVLAAMLAMFTSTNGGITFNLMLSLVFALSIIGSYGLLYNLLAAYEANLVPVSRDEKQGIDHENGKGFLSSVSHFPSSVSLLGAFFAPLFLVIIGNVEGFLELLRSYGIGWSNGTSRFWLWLNMKDLSDAPNAPFFWNPRFWFWWRASRVVHDYDLRGNFIEVIDEFPFFSYLLGDLHPHVLAMPFGLLAAALALNLYLGGWKGETDIFGLKIPVRKQGLVLMAVVLGGLAFLNTWDFPIYLAVVSGAFILSLVNERGWGWDLIEDFLKFSIPLALASIVLYLPFYLSFSSQAGGLLPNVIFPTRGAYLWIMFATLLVPLFLFLAWMPGKREANWKAGFLLTIGLTLVLWFFSTALGVIAGQTDIGASFINAQGLTSTWAVLSAATLRRLQFSGGLLTLILLVGVALSYLCKATPKPAPTSSDLPPAESSHLSSPQPIPFVLMFIVFGGLLVLAPEFVYLRDQFGTRMNTIFKFYYQAWALWSLAAAFGFVVLLRELRNDAPALSSAPNPPSAVSRSLSYPGIKLGLFMVAMTVILLIGLTYPLLSLPNKTENFNVANPGARTLDGAAYLEKYNADDYAAIQWLAQAQPGIVAEAVGGSYSEYARVSTYSGQPSVLGWPGHESQWRGGSAEMGGRAEDLTMLYATSNWMEAESILKRYDIRYVYLGRLEHATYDVDERKFASNLSEVYRQGQVVIYEVAP